MAILQQVINKAMLFSLSRSTTSSLAIQSKEFIELYDAVSKLNVAELSYNSYEQFNIESESSLTHLAPVFYMNIRENQHLNASIFTLRPRREIPLHDHPGIHGLLKVIQGAVRIRSYSYLNDVQHRKLTDEWNSKSNGQPIRKLFKDVNRWEEKFVLPIIEHNERTLTAEDPPAIVTPSRCNIHRVQALDETTAFFDILSPPYYPPNPNRDCHYFKILQANEKFTISNKADGSSSNEKDEDNVVLEQLENQMQTEQLTWLLQIRPPSSYFCDSVTYRGPVLTIPTEIELMEQLQKGTVMK